MIAYSKDWLYNIYVREQLAEARHEGCMSQERQQELNDKHPVKFYTPGFFARIGLGIVAIILVSFATGFAALLVQPEQSGGIFCIVMGVLLYAAAEMIINSNNHYNSGIDNVLLWSAAAFVIIGIGWQLDAFEGHYGSTAGSNRPEIILCLSGCAILSALAVRFTDSVLSIAAGLAFLCAVFFICQSAVSALPFIMMAASAVLYYLASGSFSGFELYRYCTRYLKILALVALYASGNYFMIQSLDPYLHIAQYKIAGVFFWLWTMAFPLVYLLLGIRNKNIIFIRTSVIFIAASVLTFKRYHHVLSPEAALVIAGIVLIAVSYSCIQYLKTPNGGFTFAPEYTSDEPALDKMLTAHMVDNATANNTKTDSGWS